jgi:hypothetical protein
LSVPDALLKENNRARGTAKVRDPQSQADEVEERLIDFAVRMTNVE